MTHVEQPAVGGLRFEVLAEVAVGQTARVDLCRTVAPVKGQLIAVKRLVPEIASDPTVASRFLDEVWMTSALRHPNVVGVMGWGHDDRGAYLAVELVQGVSLERLLKTVVETREEFPERLVVYICSAIARGLAAAHELKSDRGEPLGIVHRDLGPSNVLVGFNGDVKIADFGLATAKNRLTQTTSALPSRSVSHLSPEDLRGEAVDARADIYGLGVILYELITGRPAYSGSDELETSRAVLSGPLPDPLAHRPKIDRTLVELIRRCMDKDKSRRPETAREVHQALDGWLVSHGYRDDNVEALGRFVRRNAMRQMRWFERVIAGGEQPAAPEPTPARPVAAKPTQSSRDSIPTKDTETTVIEQQKKPSTAPRRARTIETSTERPRREAMRSVLDPPSVDRPGIPKLNQDDEEEGENIPTVAVRRVPSPTSSERDGVETVNERQSPARARAVVVQPPPAASLRDEITSSSIELLDDPSTDDRARTLKSNKGPMAAAPTARADGLAATGALPSTSVPVIAPPAIASAAPGQAASSPAQRPPPPLPPRPAAVSPRPITRETSSSSIESSTMTLPNQLLAPEYIAHQVERLRGNAQRKAAEAALAREEAEAARLEAEAAEADARQAEKAVEMALDALAMAKDSQTSRAAERLEEALSLVDGPAQSMVG